MSTSFYVSEIILTNNAAYAMLPLFNKLRVRVRVRVRPICEGKFVLQNQLG